MSSPVLCKTIPDTAETHKKLDRNKQARTHARIGVGLFPMYIPYRFRRNCLRFDNFSRDTRYDRGKRAFLAKLFLVDWRGLFDR